MSPGIVGGVEKARRPPTNRRGESQSPPSKAKGASRTPPNRRGKAWSSPAGAWESTRTQDPRMPGGTWVPYNGHGSRGEPEPRMSRLRTRRRCSPGSCFAQHTKGDEGDDKERQQGEDDGNEDDDTNTEDDGGRRRQQIMGGGRTPHPKARPSVNQTNTGNAGRYSSAIPGGYTLGMAEGYRQAIASVELVYLWASPGRG